jgi:hypothetical protein
MQEEKHHEHEHHKLARIIIDRQHLESPAPTTGAALYELGKVKTGHTLYREVPGPHEDHSVPNDASEIHLNDGEKFYSEPTQPDDREVEIIIDRKHLRSPRKTTGAALYVLGGVLADYTLYRETSGPEEDEPIPNDATPIRVHRDEKFASSAESVG